MEQPLVIDVTAQVPPFEILHFSFIITFKQNVSFLFFWWGGLHDRYHFSNDDFSQTRPPSCKLKVCPKHGAIGVNLTSVLHLHKQIFRVIITRNSSVFESFSHVKEAALMCFN